MAKPTLRHIKKTEVIQLDDMREPERRVSEYTKKMSLYVAPATWKALNLRKIDTERPVNELVNEAIAQYLSRSSGM
jgi:hypothetical protein